MPEGAKTNEELLQLAALGDHLAQETLVEQNTGLVHSVVKRFLGRGHEAEDLFQIGCIGLIKAVQKFDLSFGVKFSTYAVPMIMGEIKRFLRDDGIIKVSREQKRLCALLNAERERRISCGEESSISAIAGAVGISAEDASVALASYKASYE